MKRFGQTGWWIALIAFAIAACNTTYVATEKNYTQYNVNRDSTKDATAEKIIEPYRDSLANKMNVVIGSAEKTLTKAQPESELGNFCADVVLTYTKAVLHQAVDASIINYGGIRMPSIPQGDITVGKVYELLPFDNTIVIVSLIGDSLQKACDVIAEKGGWPVSGLRFNIENNKAVGIAVNDQPLQRDKMYNVVTIDYVANGGDNMFVMKSGKQFQTGVLFRDLMLDFIRSSHQPVSATLDNRIVK